MGKMKRMTVVYVEKKKEEIKLKNNNDKFTK